PAEQTRGGRGLACTVRTAQNDDGREYAGRQLLAPGEPAKHRGGRSGISLIVRKCFDSRASLKTARLSIHRNIWGCPAAYHKIRQAASRPEFGRLFEICRELLCHKACCCNWLRNVPSSAASVSHEQVTTAAQGL